MIISDIEMPTLIFFDSGDQSYADMLVIQVIVRELCVRIR